jgi:hypothetical protein
VVKITPVTTPVRRPNIAVASKLPNADNTEPATTLIHTKLACGSQTNRFTNRPS